MAVNNVTNEAIVWDLRSHAISCNRFISVKGAVSLDPLNDCANVLGQLLPLLGDAQGHGDVQSWGILHTVKDPTVLFK